ncbi:hypothetical protein PSTG_07248 [Puccinia striiformis f. sp. tritici PST-78]|uniref:Uncharacterized protein n=1 Tax=Puccinia striiformis f. sp. tritici PST-78 TaxID=1165861 RepID=A0A0L0VKM6_9BASI|nr:hypothetical protein PSTG_07248 [Puccinia striiformis f. sp. tritici PST-78]
MVSSAKDIDSNMSIANNDGPFVPEEADVKPTINPSKAASWEAIRAEILCRSPPHLRFRATWDGFGRNPRGKVENQKDLNMIIVFVPALGNGRTDTEKPDISLHSALAELKIRPKMVCRAHDHLDWPSEYAIHLAPSDALLLPASQDRHRGVFYGTRGKKLAYLWNLMPINAEETMSMVGQYLRVRTHLFACGPLNSKDTVAENDLKYALQIDQGVSATPRWTDAICDKIKHNGEKPPVSGVTPALLTYLVESATGRSVLNFSPPVRYVALKTTTEPAAPTRTFSTKDLSSLYQSTMISWSSVRLLSPRRRKRLSDLSLRPQSLLTFITNHPIVVVVLVVHQDLLIVESQWADQLQAADPAHKEQTIRKELTFYDVSDSSDSSTPIMSRYNTLKSMSTSKLQPVISYAPVFIRATAMNSPCQSILFTCEPLNVPLDLS